MQAYKLLFSFLLAFGCSSDLALGEDRRIYSYALKKSIPFRQVLQKSQTFLLVDENCSVCHSLLKNPVIKNQKKLSLATITDPHFSWLARLKRQNGKKMVYNIRSLKLKNISKTPQLLHFNQQGTLELKLYGRSKIIHFFKDNS